MRNTFSSRNEGNVWPFVLKNEDLYDFNRWNNEYIIYFWHGGSVEIDLEGFHGNPGIPWLNVLGTDWTGKERIKKKKYLSKLLVKVTGLQLSNRIEDAIPGNIDFTRDYMPDL